jgi:hypothetical protein
MKKFSQKLDELFACAGEAEYIGIDVPSEEAEANFVAMESGVTVPHAETGAFQAIKSSVMGHGEQTVQPDDCEFGDNDLCSVDADRQFRR